MADISQKFILQMDVSGLGLGTPFAGERWGQITHCICIQDADRAEAQSIVNL
jgi:hypothetical protein